MQENRQSGAFVLGVFILLGMLGLGYLLGNAAIQFKEYERSVRVKGLSEREYLADIVIWPIQFAVASNNLDDLYDSIDKNSQTIISFLESKGLGSDEISNNLPAITDKSAQHYGNQARALFRYTGSQTITVYSDDIKKVRVLMTQLSDLGKEGIVFNTENYQAPIEYLFTRLNEVKPEMIEEATRKAREVAEKFAADSQSSLGKIKRASQGQFSINARDNNNPHIKKVRVVSTVEYYLSD